MMARLDPRRKGSWWWIRGLGAKKAEVGSERCVLCGAKGEVTVGVVRHVGLWLMPGTEAWVSVCSSCRMRLWRARAKELGIGAIGVIAVGLALLVVRAWSPWVGVWGLSLAGLGGLVVVWLLMSGSRWWGRCSEPLLLVRDGSGVALVSQDPGIASRVAVAAGAVAEERRWEGWRHGWTVGAWFVAVLVLPWVVWWQGRVDVRVANQGSESWVLWMDGREVVVVPPMPGENPGALLEVSVPRGWRLVERRRLDGHVVERGWWRFDGGADYLYAPPVEGRCYWVEERSYGRARRGPDRTRELPRDVELHVFPWRVDKWFGGLEPGRVQDRWFSGGVAHAVRVGRCDGGVGGRE